MASFTKNTALNTPFGRNEYLRSTVGCKFESYTLAKETVPFVTVDGVSQRFVQRGMVMAKITSGPDSGKIGPFQGSGTAEVQTLTESGTISGGTYTLTYSGQTTAAIAYNAGPAVIQAALEALSNIVPGDILVTSPGSAGVDTVVVSITFYGNLTGNVAQITTNVGSLTGSTPGITAATGTAGVAGAADGRQTLANIVGILDTFLPWQLMEHDVEVACMYIGTAVQGWCLEMQADATIVALTNTTADAMRSTKGLDVTFK